MQGEWLTAGKTALNLTINFMEYGMLNKQIEKLLNEKLGMPTRSVKKVSAWTLTTNSDLVLETNYDLNTRSADANVWVPVEYKNRLSRFTVIDYPEGKGRHSNTYPSKGLERDKGAIKVKLSSLADAGSMLGQLL